jgi:glycosyltransferase involved in cell wall biosynthesis
MKPSREKTRLCVVTTHPIQYIAPWFRSLAQHEAIDLHVVFLRELDAGAQGIGFGQAFTWDVPLREGYSNEALDIPMGASAVFAGLRAFVRTLRRQHADIVLVTGWNEPLLAFATPAARVLGYKTIVRGESNDKRDRSLIARLIHRALLAFASAVTIIGSGNRRFYESYAYSQDRIFPGVYFVENDRMLAMAEARAIERRAIRASEGVRVDEVVFAFCGKHVPFKRPDWLVEAAGQLVKEGLRIRLRFAGSGELTESLKERCDALGIAASFTGFLNQTEMWRAYIGADVFVLPSTHRETWGLVVNEAMLFGLPAIVSDDVGCSPDLVVENETGWVFRGGVDALAASMRHAVREQARLHVMGLRARHRVTSNYSMEIATSGLLQAIAYLRR